MRKLWLQKCRRIRNYCAPEFKVVFELLQEYDGNDWTALEKQLKKMYWQHNQQRDATAALNKLVKNAANLDQRFPSQVYRDFGYPGQKRRSLLSIMFVCWMDFQLNYVPKFCAEKSWRLSGSQFNELKGFILYTAVNALLEKNSLLLLLLQLFSIKSEVPVNPPASTLTAKLTPTTTPAQLPASSDDIAEVTNNSRNSLSRSKLAYGPTPHLEFLPTMDSSAWKAPV